MGTERGTEREGVARSAPPHVEVLELIACVLKALTYFPQEPNTCLGQSAPSHTQQRPSLQTGATVGPGFPHWLGQLPQNRG